MGLDMYLSLRRFESREDLQYPENLKKLEEKQFKRNFLSITSEYQVGYWRKFNALHNWFVNVCGEGEGNCQTIYVSWDNLEILKDIVGQILKDHSLAPELLPTTSGFFFDSQKYDEYYFENLEYTKELLEDLLELDRREFYVAYRASW